MSSIPKGGKRIPPENDFEELFIQGRHRALDMILSDSVYFAMPLAAYGNLNMYASGSGGVTQSSDGINLSTGTTSGSVALADIRDAPTRWEYPEIDWSKKLVFRTKVEFQNDANQVIQIKIGGADTGDHVGFRVDNDTLKMSVADGTTENTSTIETFTATQRYSLTALFTPGEKAEFWVAETKVGELTSNIPSAGSVYRLAGWQIENTAAADKVLVSNWIEWALVG